jgi:hypothetical protein
VTVACTKNLGTRSDSCIDDGIVIRIIQDHGIAQIRVDNPRHAAQLTEVLANSFRGDTKFLLQPEISQNSGDLVQDKGRQRKHV